MEGPCNGIEIVEPLMGYQIHSHFSLFLHLRTGTKKADSVLPKSAFSEYVFLLINS